MFEDSVRQLLSESGRHTLETMFFTTPDGVSSETKRPAGELIAASLTFAGAPPGRFGAILSEPVARAITANFLGAEDETALAPAQLGDVVAELTNIICGSVLSELEANANFDISTPVPIYVAAADPGPDYREGSPVACRFELAGGSIVLYLAFGEAA